MNSDRVTVGYEETDAERRLHVRHGDRTVVLVQPRSGYGMVIVRDPEGGRELERYYALDMALDHAAEILGIRPHEITVPEDATELGM